MRLVVLLEFEGGADEDWKEGEGLRRRADVLHLYTAPAVGSPAIRAISIHRLACKLCYISSKSYPTAPASAALYSQAAAAQLPLRLSVLTQPAFIWHVLPVCTGY